MATHKPFRELLPPGTNFDFLGKQRLWLTLSLLLSLASVAVLFINHQTRGSAMNWSTDFRGGTEIIFRFDDQAGLPTAVDTGTVRKALEQAGHDAVEVSDFAWEEVAADGSARKVGGLLIRTPEYGAVPAAKQQELAAGLRTLFADRDVLKTTWSGDRVFVRSMKAIDCQAASDFFAKAGLELRPWAPEEAERFTIAEEGTGEYTAQLAVRGIDAQFQQQLGEALGKDVKVGVVNVYGVGAKAGSKLRNDGIASLFYAILLVMLYLAVRFDVRYAPGAVVAMLHDAIMVVGVFALTWSEVSLTTVAALLTVVGYSVNDTVIIFDRIRENAHKLKDKSFSTIVNISINETVSRSLLTSMTVFVTTLMMNIFGTGLVRNFAFAMNVGVIVGTYSSIFIASPVVLWVHRRWYSGPAAKARGRALASTDDAEPEPGV
jgi:preprotein translocase subunit SecF